MDGDKDDKSLFEKAIESVKDIASSVTEAVKSAPPSARTETAIPVEENLDAPPMTAEELAQHAAADTQPVTPAKKARRGKTTSPNLSGRITPTYDFPPPDSPMPSSRNGKGVVKKAKKPTKAAKKKAVKQAAKKTVKKAKKAPPKKSAKKSKSEEEVKAIIFFQPTQLAQNAKNATPPHHAGQRLGAEAPDGASEQVRYGGRELV